MIKASFDNDKGSVVQRFSKSGTESPNNSLVYNLQLTLLPTMP